jgi:hypothetical protein
LTIRAAGVDAVDEALGRTGHKAQLVDNVHGVILDHNVETGNPADAHVEGDPGKRARTRCAGKTPACRPRRRR